MSLQNLYTIQEAAQLLRISRRHLYDIIRERSIAAYKLDGAFRVSEADLSAYLNARRVPAFSPAGVAAIRKAMSPARKRSSNSGQSSLKAPPLNP